MKIIEDTTMFDHFLEGIYIVDKNRKILYFNKAAEMMTGYTSQEMVDSHCYNDLLNHIDESGKKLCQDGCPLVDSIETNQVKDHIVYLHHRNGHRVKVRVKTIPISESGHVTGAVEVFLDQTDRNLLQEAIQRQSDKVNYDTLTKTRNRRYLEEVFAKQVAYRSTDALGYGVLFLDIDHFKDVNDTYGHKVGDEMLKMFAQTVTNAIRKDDVLVRFGGEEFVVCLNQVQKDDLLIIAEKVRLLVASSSLPHASQSLEVTVSIGATLIKENEPLLPALKRADEAMYQAKKDGRNQVVFKR